VDLAPTPSPYTTLFGSAPAQLEEALRERHRLERVRGREAGQPRERLVELRVVLHRARPERVEPEIDRGVPCGQAREVPHHLDLRSEEHTSELQSRENIV